MDNQRRNQEPQGTIEAYDVVVVGGGPAGATAATDLAREGYSVALLDRAGRIKPCGGAIPPRLIRDFDIPEKLLVAHATSARIVSPQDVNVDMPIEGGFVGMVDRDVFDEWLRERAELAGATRKTGTYRGIERDESGSAIVRFKRKEDEAEEHIRARIVIGADGANSAVAKDVFPSGNEIPYVFAYHEIVRSPQTKQTTFDGSRCEVHYRGDLSPDFYSWVFPHGETTSIGTGTAHKGQSMRSAVKQLRRTTGLDEMETVRGEGAPIPMRPRKKWDNGRDILLVGDAAGVVAPASGEGIYYAMVCARMAGEAVKKCLQTGDAKALAQTRKQFMKEHGKVFWILGIMQHFWYKNDKRRERFVSMCRDPDVQKLTWEAYMNKELVRRDPMAHVRIFFKDLAHLFRLVSPG